MGKTKTKPTKKKPAARPSLGQRIIAGLDELKRHFQGEDVGVRVTRVKIPPLVLCVRELKAAREAAGLTQAQVAEKAGLRLETLSRLELGKVKNPTIDTLQRYAEAVGVEIKLSVVPVKPKSKSRA